jgi:hypothetical protein
VEYGCKTTASDKKLWLDGYGYEASIADVQSGERRGSPKAQDPASLGLASAEACFQDNMMQAPWSQEMIGMKLIGRDELTTW